MYQKRKDSTSLWSTIIKKSCEECGLRMVFRFCVGVLEGEFKYVRPACELDEYKYTDIPCRRVVVERN